MQEMGSGLIILYQKHHFAVNSLQDNEPRPHFSLQAVQVIQDGRWKHPPNPVEWTIRPRLIAPLALRQDSPRGLTAVLMTRSEECFAIAVPHDGEGHRSVYFSLFGRDLANGTTVETNSRLVIGRGLSAQKALELYDAFCREKS